MRVRGLQKNCVTLLLFSSYLVKSLRPLSSSAARKTLSSTQLRMSTFSQYTDKEFPLVMDDFGIRQFNNPDYTGTQVHFDIAQFEERVNEYYASGNYPLIEGYAPFCKHLFVPNFAGVKCGYTEITPQNKAIIKSGYESRKEGELAVLVQWIDAADLVPPEAAFLDIILYSRDQITKENVAMGSVLRTSSITTFPIATTLTTYSSRFSIFTSQLYSTRL